MDENEFNKSEETKSFNTKIIITAIVSVLLGAAFVLSLITFGMNVQRKFDNDNAKQRENNKVISIINLEYEETSIGYSFMDYGKYENGTVSPQTVEKLGGNKGDSYYIVNSNDKLASTLKIIGHSGEYEVDANFFKSGSVIAVPVENDGGFINCRVKNVVRDESYNVTIDIEYEDNMLDGADNVDAVEDEEVDEADDDSILVGYIGQLVLVKLPNIQPKLVTVNIAEKKN